MEPVRAKICGLTDKLAVASAVKHGAAYIGFVFYPPSPRYVTPQQAATLAAPVVDKVQTAAVVVDMDDDALDALLSVFRPNILQLHGKETASRVQDIRRRFGVPVMKAIAVRNGDDIARGLEYQAVADMLLFDAKAPVTMAGALPGGNGLAFDWALLAARQFTVPWMLSGGLTADNVAEAVAITHASIVDVSSSIEKLPGKKDPLLIEQFLLAVKNIGENGAV